MFTSKNRIYTLTLLTLALWAQSCTSSNILGLFPHFGYSHFKVFYPILQNLAERGHNVTVITYIKNPDPHPNYEEFIITGKETHDVITLDMFTPARNLKILFHEYYLLHAEGQESCDKFYKSGYVDKILARHARVPYDLVIMENFNTDCYFGVPYLLQVPVVGVSSCALMPWYYDRIALPDIPSYVQSEFIGFPETLNWQQRLTNFIQAKGLRTLYRFYTNYLDSKVIKKYLQIDVDVNEIAKSLTSLIFVNQHYSLSGNRPITPQLIQMGGVHINEKHINDTLPKDITNFLDKIDESATKGVLFISWGSMIRSSSLDRKLINTILKVLKKFPLKVIWKWETDEKPTNSEQILFVKWAPQFNLLCHPKVKYFWGHGGLLGTTEAVYCGKPLIVTPIYGDQFTNANAVENRKVGVIMDYNDIDENRLVNTIQEIMRTRYTENALALSKIFRNREKTPIETTTWWIEHLLQNGKIASELLHNKAVHLNWFVYHSLDSALILLLGTILFLIFICRLVKIANLAWKRRLTHKIKQN
ncbi:UDP-glucosyltransferase 2 [Teleopsis dalmanni]|uniref:UDP-glucosyltransferase 2 n=1 Tax=Teleopsis dalmanni TaxID=139649 RepID=UPI0018CE4718|nr:UDP-glucosyltransferase 2 [Teleopsis dalmanni]